MREDRPFAEAASAVVDIQVVDRLGKEPGYLGDLAAIFGQVGLPVGAGLRRERRRLSQHVLGARHGEPRGECVAQPAVVTPVPPGAQVGGLAKAAVEHLRVADGRVIADPIHHHLADDGPDAVDLGRPERRLERRLVDGPVHQRGRRPGVGEGREGERCEPLGRLGVELPLEREDVRLEPGQQVEPGPETGVRELRQVGMQVDESRQRDERPMVRRPRQHRRTTPRRARPSPTAQSHRPRRWRRLRGVCHRRRAA